MSLVTTFSRRPGLSGVLITLCVVLHAAGVAVVAPKCRRAFTFGNHRSLIRQELRDVTQMKSLGFLSIVWAWFLYLLHTHWCDAATETAAFKSSAPCCDPFAALCACCVALQSSP